MQEFQYGPFEFSTVGRPITHNGRCIQRWSMMYGHQFLGEHAVQETASRAQVVEAFSNTRAEFVQSHQKEDAPPPEKERGILVRLVRSTAVTGVLGKVLGEFEQHAEIAGMAAGLIDDRFDTWLVNAAGQCLPMQPDEFERLRAAHTALAVAEVEIDAAQQAKRPLDYAWIADLLPDDVVTQDSQVWRAPTSWELRHIVGEGGFTGLSGAQAAQLVGVTPQNFRKYTAREGASTRQAMSFAMWHLLLHKLNIQAAS